jgi:cytochrome c-type biogenesis protein CcmE
MDEVGWQRICPQKREKSMKTVNIGLLVGIAVVAMIGVSVFAFWGNAASASKYSTFNEAKKTGDNVHIIGKWVMQDRAVNGDNSFTFFMQDTTQQVTQVRFDDPMPGNFKEAAERFEVGGQFEGNVFVADRILMKCPSKYNKDQMTEAIANK